MSIFLCTDNNYVLPAYIALYSLLSNYKGNTEIDVFLLITDSVDERNLSLIKSLEKGFPLLSITIIKVCNSFSDVHINTPWITTATMFRLLIPQIARKHNISKCIYLDSDIVVEGDISELYETDLQNYCIGGVKERAISVDSNTELRDLLAVSDLQDYINAGVLLFNIKEIEKNDLSSKLESAGHRTDYSHNDQDVINATFHDRIKILPVRFNAINFYVYDHLPETISEYGKLNILEANKNPLIIHFDGDCKPWTARGTILSGKWRKYVRLQDKDVQREYFKPFIKASQLPLRRRIWVLIISITLKMRIYRVMVNIYRSLKHVANTR